MAIPLPRRRNNPSGRQNTGQIPTRANIQRQNVSRDPGARGGPSAIPAGAFGGGEGVTALGAGIQQYAAAESQQLQQELNRSDYINTELEKGNLANELTRATGAFDAVSGSYTNSDGTVDKDGMAKLDRVIEDITKRRLDVVQQNQSMSQRASDEFANQAELVKQNVYSKLQTQVTKARTDQFKLSLQAQLVQVAADKAAASDVVNLIKTNRQISHGFISSLDTSTRNEVLSGANAGLLKHAARKFVMGGQFREARTRITDIVEALGENNISTTGWTGKSIRDAYLYIDEEQTKFNNTKQSATLSALAEKIAAIDKFDLTDSAKQALKIRVVTGDNGGNIPEFKQKLSIVEADYRKLENPTPEQTKKFVEMRDTLLGYTTPTKEPPSVFAQKVESLNKMFPQPFNEKDAKKFMDGLYKLTTGLEPKDPKDKSELQEKNDYLDAQFTLYKTSGGKDGLTPDLYTKAKLFLNSGYKEAPLSEYTVKQKAREDYLDKQLKIFKDTGGKDGISPENHKRMMAKVMTDVELPSLDENFDLKDQRLIDNLVDSYLGADVFGSGAKQPQKGYEEFSMKFKSAVARAMITGEYSNGLAVSPEKNYFDIINMVGQTAEFKGKGPKRQKPSEKFDSRVGIKLTRTKKGIDLTIADDQFSVDPSESLSSIIGETSATVNSDYFKGRLINAGIKTGLNVDEATGLWSGLKNSIAKFSEILGKETEDPQVTQSRLLYSLIARDFIRFVSLSPRFAVKEQELLRDLFPSSGALNSPWQTRSRLLLFRNLLKKKIVDLRSTAINVQNPEKQEESIESAKVWAGTIRNINTLMPEVPSVENLDNLKNLPAKETYKYLQSEIYGDNPRVILRSDLNDYKERLIKQRGKKAGEARYKVLENKIEEYQKQILKEKNS
jgi:hypothetical protein